jgi:Immunity protein 53
MSADPNDEQFVAAAMAGTADRIDSGDKHLLAASGWSGIAVREPRSFVDVPLALHAGELAVLMTLRPAYREHENFQEAVAAPAPDPVRCLSWRSVMNEIERLQAWYSAQCNGDWEHAFGVRIDSLDNPGWMLTVDLSGTSLEGLDYPRVDRATSEVHWIQCAVRERKWCGAGGASDLQNLIQEFLRWAETAHL